VLDLLPTIVISMAALHSNIAVVILRDSDGFMR